MKLQLKHPLVGFVDSLSLPSEVTFENPAKIFLGGKLKKKHFLNGKKMISFFPGLSNPKKLSNTIRRDTKLKTTLDFTNKTWNSYSLCFENKCTKTARSKNNSLK